MADAPAPAPARLDPNAVRRHLTRLVRQAPAWLPGEVGRRMDERLGWIRSQPSRALVWWPELGGGEDLLRRRYPGAQLWAQSAPGAAAAAERPWWRRPFQNRPTPRFDPATGAPVELVWANMMLHWVDDVPAQLAVWHRALATDGFLMFSAFGPDTVRALQAVHDAIGAGPAGPAFIDMHDLGDQLVHGGFADPVMDMELLTLSWPDAAAMRAELRGLGGNAAPGRPPGLRTPRWQARWTEAVNDTLRGPDGRLQLRVEIVYGHAFKPAPRPAMKTETSVSLDDMRALVRRGRTGNPR